MSREEHETVKMDPESQEKLRLQTLEAAESLKAPSFGSRAWAWIKTAAKWVGSNMLGPVIALVLIAVAIMLVSMGFKELQIGGLLGRLLGKKEDEGDGKKTIELANSVDKDRIGPDGKLIPIGTPDSKGMTQVTVVPIKEPGLFSDPAKVVFTPPNETKPIEVVLPEGVTNKDVEQVIVVKPNVVVVTVKDSSGISAEKVDDLLSKYGKK